MDSWHRRDFIRAGGRAAGSLALAGLALRPTAAGAFDGGGAVPLFRISLAEWSLHRALAAQEIDHLDFARIARVDYGIEAVEYVNSFFKDKAQDAAYLAEMNRRAADQGVYQHLIMCDAEGRIGDPDDAARKQAVENHYKWVAAAKTLGCATIRVNAASEGTPEQQAALAADGLRRLPEYAAQADINVVVENHGGWSSNGAWLSDVMRRVDHPRCGTLPDFGNFNLGDGQTYDRYQGVTELMRFAKAVSAKTHDFDAAGNETEKDYRRLMKIVADAGYRSWVGIEYEGTRLSEREGIAATLKLLRKIQQETAAA
ncbi:MAG: TIM barrel protein [Gemmatimonadetes bacterium]|nr:TIM barrel protein [Gemmatimonadota bacterium]